MKNLCKCCCFSWENRIRNNEEARFSFILSILVSVFSFEVIVLSSVFFHSFRVNGFLVDQFRFTNRFWTFPFRVHVHMQSHSVSPSTRKIDRISNLIFKAIQSIFNSWIIICEKNTKWNDEKPLKSEYCAFILAYQIQSAEHGTLPKYIENGLVDFLGN